MKDTIAEDEAQEIFATYMEICKVIQEKQL